MHLVSRVRPDVPHRRRASSRSSFAPGETIWTESSYKYEPDGSIEMGADAGFAAQEQWIEPTAGSR